MFDSGFGGLTVARALIDLLPDEDLVYVGDTGRYPYGPRPLEEVRGFAHQITRYLVDEHDVKLVIVACNTASAAALDELQAESPVPVVGVLSGMVFLGERPGAAEFVALGLVLASLFAVLLQPAEKAHPPATASEPRP